MTARVKKLAEAMFPMAAPPNSPALPLGLGNMQTEKREQVGILVFCDVVHVVSINWGNAQLSAACRWLCALHD